VKKGDRTLFDVPWSGGREILLASLAEVELPKKIVSAMKEDGVELVGKFVQMSSTDLLRRPGLGFKSVREVEARLSIFDLRLGMELRGWDDRLAKDARRAFGRNLKRLTFEKSGAASPRQVDLKQELLCLLRLVEDERNAYMLAKLFGFDGNGTKTLESVGAQFGLTRERVRQIAARAELKLAEIWRPLPHLRRAKELLLAMPELFSAAECLNALQDAGLVDGIFNLSGIIHALEVIGEPVSIKSKNIAGKEIFGNDRGIERAKRTIQLLRSETSSTGCTNVQRLSLAMGLAIEDAGSIRDLLVGFAEVHWLGEEKTWLISTRTTRNRIVNVASRILSISPRVKLNELRTALLRPVRIRLVPPPEILGQLLVHQGIATLDGGMAVATTKVDNIELGKNDTAMALAFKELGSPLSREQLEEYCIDDLGMNPTCFYLYLSYCPLVAKLGVGVFGLVGESVEIGRVEAIQSGYRAQQFEASSGWSRAGTLWFHFEIDRPSLTSGTRAVPTFVQNFVPGAWLIDIGDGIEAGYAKLEHGFISGLKASFVALGATNGDFLQLDFQIPSRKLLVRVVGEEQIEFSAAPTVDEFDEDVEPID